MRRYVETGNQVCELITPDNIMPDHICVLFIHL